MNSGYRGRKNVSFRAEDEESDPHDNQQYNNRSDREEYGKYDQEESRMVKLLPDANMTISVKNDFKDYRPNRGRGNRGILKGNNFRDDTNLSYNQDRYNNSYNSGRGFETGLSGRGRGRPRGYGYEGEGYHRGGRGRPLSGNYDYESGGQRYYNRDRQHSDSYERPPPPRDSYARQGSGEGDTEKEWPSTGRPFRGRSKSASDRSWRGRGGRGRGRGRYQRGGDGTSAEDEHPGSGDGDSKEDQHDGGEGVLRKPEEPEWLESEDPPEAVNGADSAVKVEETVSEERREEVEPEAKEKGQEEAEAPQGSE